MTHADLSNLATHFTSLGTRCELGFVQQRLNASTLDLFKFAYAPLAGLTRALQDRFAAFDKDENFAIRMGGPEFQIVIPAYGFEFHTYAMAADHAAAAVRKTQMRRLRWLKDKLITELEQAEKIYVFRGNEGDLNSNSAELAGALSSFNKDNILLWVTLAPELAKAGQVVRISQTELHGYLDRLGLGMNEGLSLPYWISVLIGARELSGSPWVGSVTAPRYLTDEEITLPDDLATNARLDFIMGSARRSIEAGDIEDGLHSFAEIRRLDPSHVAAYIEAAEALLAAGRAAEALDICQSALPRFPDHEFLYELLVKCFRGTPDAGTAVAFWEKVMSLGVGNSVQIRINLADALGAAGRFEEAAAILTAELKQNPRNIKLHSSYAALAEATGDWLGSMARWQAAEEYFPQNSAVYFRQARALEMLGRNSDAAATLSRGITKMPGEQQLYFNLAEIEAKRGATDKAVTTWKRAAEKFPGDPSIIIQLGRLLVQSRRLKPAEQVLRKGIDRFPGNAEIHADFARVAAAREDWPEALIRWSATETRFPDYIPAYVEQSRILRRLERFDEAEVVLRRGVDRRPDAENLHADLARVAMATKDWGKALERWRTVEARFPAYLPGYGDQSFTLRMLQRFDEAEAAVSRALAKAPDSESLHAEFARIAMVRQDWPEALARWKSVETHFPNHVFAYSEPGQILRQLRRFDEAESVLKRGIERLPNAEGLLAELARVAMAREDWEEALVRWRLVETRFQAHAPAYGNQSFILQRLRRFDEAEACISRGLALFPDSEALRGDFARAAAAREDWPKALARWKAIETRFPSNISAYGEQSQILRQLQRFEEAEVVLRRGITRFPGAENLHADLARVAMAKRDWQGAYEYWRAVEDKFPTYSPTYCDQSFVLRMLKRFDEAEAVVSRGLVRFPESESLHAEFARIAMVRQDWPEALVRWEAVETQFPGHVFAYSEPSQILRQLKRFDEAEAVVQRGLKQLPDSESLVAELARVRTERGD